MPPWTPSAIGGALFIALHYVCVRAAAGLIEDRLGALVLEATACLGIGVSLLFGRSPSGVSGAGVAFAAAGGLAISFSSVLLFTALRRGGPVAATGTVVLGGGVALSAIVAPWLFSESYTPRRLLGIALGLAAMWVLGGET
jgi:hypothetical protein